MVDVDDSSKNSEGSPEVERLAAEFGISTNEANAALAALVPGVFERIIAKASEPAGFLSMLGAPGAGQPLAAFADPTATPISDAERDAIVAKAAATTGLAPELLRKMAPIIGSLIVGAIMNAFQSRGLGGILSDLAKAAGPGGLGSILGQVLGGGRAEASPTPQGSPPAPGGGIDLGTILEQILKGGRGQASPTPQGSPPAPGGGIDLGTILEQILRGGRGQASPTLPGEPGRPRGDLADEIGQILRKRE